MRVVRVRIRSQGFRAYSVRAIIVPDLEIVVLIVGTLRIHPISLRVSPVNLFRQHFRLLMKVNLVLVITRLRAAIILQEVHHLVILDVVATLG